MSDLNAPLKEQLRTVPSEASVARMWRDIEARSTKARPRSLRGLPALVAALTLGSLAVIGGSTFLSLRMAQPAAILTLRDGAPWPATLIANAPRQVTLSDGSVLHLARGAQLESLRNAETQVLLKQAKGRVLYDIEPGGPRAFTIECGPVSVEVVGTRFEVDRNDTRVRIVVTEGVVLVRGDGVPDHIGRLTAGGTMEVPIRPHEVERSPEHRAATEPQPEPEVERADLTVRPPSAPWRKLAARGEHTEAYRALGQRGIASLTVSASVDDLFALSDVARLSGHAEDAVAPLSRIMEHHADDARASLAAFTLGRIQLRTLGQPARAVKPLTQALTLSLPTDLEEDTYSLLVEALVKAQKPADARAMHGRCRSAGHECRAALVFLEAEPAR